MNIYYVTLNNNDEAREISHKLLSQKLAICTNWFPITCAYSWEGEIKEEAEVVLIIKTKAGYREKIEEVIKQKIDYTNCIAELSVSSINDEFSLWLNTEI